jgi:glycosyltransferase involved in cell wall biosynthesis
MLQPERSIPMSESLDTCESNVGGGGGSRGRLPPRTKSEAAPSICIVAHYAYGAMIGGTSGHIGGVERQTTLTARWLAGRGYAVSLLTWDEGQEGAEQSIDGVRVIKMCRRDQGWPGLRFFHPRWTSLVAAQAPADADVYYQNCAEYVTGQVALWCRARGRRFVYSVANDPDVDPRLPDLRTWRERLLYRAGLQRADRIIVQTRSQQQVLRAGLGLDAVVVPMPCPGPSAPEYVAPAPPRTADRPVLWVGRVCEQKRPDRLLQIAALCPERRFELAGPAGSGDYARRILEQAAALPNVTVRGSVERSGMAQLYRQAACLCCTSDYEGFPNTFLEAWSHGLPVVSRFDPDGLIEAQGLGAAAGDAPGLAAALEGLLGDPERWRAASARARRYYEEHHTVEAALPRFERVFCDAAGAAGEV